jgi:putative aldouronate transport system substrate-binding protein
MSTNLSRRSFVRGVLGASALGLAGSLPLAGCSVGSVNDSVAAANKKVKLPDYIPYRGLRPDLPGNEQGLASAFFTYPANPARAITAVPGDGQPITAMVESPMPTPPAMGSNLFWQELNKRLGSELQLTIIPTSDWTDKFATTVAGGDLPDILEIWTPPQQPGMMSAMFADLTEHVAGDAIKKYPMLANIPTASWQQCVYDGGIYGVPVPRGAMSSYIMYRRDDLLARKGVDGNPKSFADFMQLCKQVTDTRNNVWAVGGVPLAFVQQMLGVPNNWQEQGGKLISAYEVPETKEALAATRSLIQAGVVQPDSFNTDAGTMRKTWFNAGSVLFVWDTFPAWPGYYEENTAGPSFNIGAMAVPGFNGGSGTPWLGNPTHNIAGFAKSTAKRITTLLEVCNWLAAPFGTEEYLFANYGIAGRDYHLVNGNPQLTTTGTSETALSLGYLCAGPQVFYLPGHADAARKEYESQKQLMQHAVQDPTLGLVSPTQAQQGTQLTNAITSAQNDIMQGSQPLSSWDAAVKQWQQSGGNQIRKELEKALEERG